GLPTVTWPRSLRNVCVLAGLPSGPGGNSSSCVFFDCSAAVSFGLAGAAWTGGTASTGGFVVAGVASLVGAHIGRPPPVGWDWSPSSVEKRRGPAASNVAARTVYL